ncbi:MAG: histidine--tRNA ligase family protein [Chloroflexi bacterium]|nr:histidine--tRNA ligase family protein [Chloroflexota bacterium]
MGGKELAVLTDRAGRELAIRPEMTPSVTRMVSRIYKQESKPLRLFSIANFWRNERPQRGRNREFWQLNTDIFGATALNADLEILQIALELMLAFNPPPGSFTLYLNHRRLIDAVLANVAQVPPKLRLPTSRLLDKFAKLPRPVFEERLIDIGLPAEAIRSLTTFMKIEDATQLAAAFPEIVDTDGYREMMQLTQQLTGLGYADWIAFRPSVIRGLDYYDGMVFEMFDHHPRNNRSLFGGGRYNGLASLFGAADIPAVGIAPGDETMRLFLESWKLIPDDLARGTAVYLPLLDANLIVPVNQLAQDLRRAGIPVEQGLTAQNFKQALSYAHKKRFSFTVVLGSDEFSQNMVSLKAMQTGDQKQLSLTAAIEALKQELG